MIEWKPDICVYHANCNDGFGAAWAVWKRWGDAVQYVPAIYVEPLAVSLSDMNVLFVDFSLSANELRNSPAKSIVVLDHHKSAEHELKSFAVIGNDSARVPVLLADASDLINDCLVSGEHPVIASFDMNKSGARLAWEFCHPSTPMPTLLAHIEDRDLWRFAMCGTREVHAGLSSWPQDFASWSELAVNVTKVWQSGIEILRYQRKCVAELCNMASVQDVAGFPVPCVNAPFFMASDVGHELLHLHPDAPFAATYQTVNGTRIYSLRSDDARADVSKIAKAHGGGGHRNAAGFRVPDEPVFF